MIRAFTHNCCKQKSKVIIIILIIILIVSILGVMLRMGFSFSKTIKQIAISFNIDTALIMSICKVENGFDRRAISKVGAVGLMQIMPQTAESICISNDIEYNYEKLSDTKYNITIGCIYLRYLLEKFETEWAIVAYNAGETVVSEWMKNGIELSSIPYKESREYLLKVRNIYKIYSKLY